MRLKLWKHLFLSLLLPGGLALAITLYAIVNVGKISHRVLLIEVADDINLNLLELRRYEKNILLLYEEDNVRTFNAYLDQIERRIGAKKDEMLAVMPPENYESFLSSFTAYKRAATGVIRRVGLKKKLLEDIRPLGRAVEEGARDREQALELRRHEKNFIIYREARALEELHRIARALAARQPGLKGPLREYVSVVDAIVDNQAVKDALVAEIRESGRRIETVTMEFSARERQAITTTIADAKKLFVASFVLLLGSIAGVAYLFTRNVVRSLRSVERSFNDLAVGDFSRKVDLAFANAPDEIRTFVEAYNKTLHRLGTAQHELRWALEKLVETNKELVDRQDELVEARKTSAMRMLASEIVHEINNPLTSVAMFLGTFYDELEADAAGKANVTLMLKEIRRCQTVLRELVDFARREPLSLREVRPSSLVHDACEVVTAQNRQTGVRLNVDLMDLPEKVLIDPVLVYQALMNILSNAFQFSPPGGTIDVRGSCDEETFTVTVTDRGVGIQPENLAYIFRPFFSTRKEIGGTGLGLAITKKIIERHRGRIAVESTPGEGTVFTITLPRRQEEESDGQGPGD